MIFCEDKKFVKILSSKTRRKNVHICTHTHTLNLKKRSQRYIPNKCHLVWNFDMYIDQTFKKR